MRVFSMPRTPYLHAEVKDPRTGKRSRFTTHETTQGAAMKVALSRLRMWEAERAVMLDGRRPVALGTAVDAYVEALQAAKNTSAPLLAGIAKKLLGASQGRWGLDREMWLHDLEPRHLAALVTARSSEGNGPQTIAHELKLLRAATKRASGLRLRVPEIDNWRLPELPKKTRYLSVDDFLKLHDYLNPDRPSVVKGYGTCQLTGKRREGRQDSQDLLVILAMTGGRWQEIAQLTWGQVDIAGRVIRIYGSKSDAERLVPMPDMAAEVLTRRMGDANKDRASPVFPGAGGGLRALNSCRPILQAMEACGLNSGEEVRRYGKATVHSLRHTFASLLLQSGAELAEVQAALGHATLHMTRRYAHLSKRQSAARLGSLLSEITN